MGMLARIASAIRNKPAPERRDGGLGFSVGMAAGFGFSTFTAPGNTMVSALMAENLATINAGVALISSTVGSLPISVYKTEGSGRVEVPDHPVARLLRQPNERQTTCDFFEWLTASFILRGNALAVIEGDLEALNPIPWEHVIPILLPNRHLAFDILALGPWGGTGTPMRKLDSEVLHVRNRSDDSFLGRSPISRSPEVVECALGLQKYAAAISQNQASIGGVLKHPLVLSKDAKDWLLGQFEQRHAGAHNAARTLLLDEGMTFEATSANPLNAQVLESRRFMTEELARIIGCPLPLLNIWDHSSFTNSATASQWFGQFSVLPIVRKIEAEIQRVLFPDPHGPYHALFDMGGLMRGDSSTQRAANLADVAGGILLPDEARHDLGLNPLAKAAAP